MEDRSKKNPFSALSARGPDAVRHELDRRWEHARVEFVFNRFGFSKQKRKLTTLAIERKGDNLLTFALFHEMYPDFPMLLGANRLSHLSDPLHRSPKAFHPEWFKNFNKLPFMTGYREVFEQYGEITDIKPVGMMFPRKGFQQGLIVHNGDISTFVPGGSSCHVYFGDGENAVNLVVQPFVGWLDHLKKSMDWRPEL